MVKPTVIIAGGHAEPVTGCGPHYRPHHVEAVRLG
jgi:hypothetical protein